MRFLSPAAVLVLLSGAAAAQPAVHDDGIEACAHGKIARMTPTDPDLPGGGFGSREAMTDTDVLHNNVDLEIFISTVSITGSNTMTVKSLVDNLTQFTFMLRSNYTISQILFNGTDVLTATSVGTYGRRVTLPHPVARDEVFTLRIAYSGPAVSRGFGSIDFGTQGGQPMVASLSEPYYAATWWPAKDGDVLTPGDNKDKATFEMAVTAPSNLVTISNGLLQGFDTLSGSRRRYRWATSYQTASYLACFGTTNYNTWTQTYNYPLDGGGTGSMPVQFYIFPGDDTASNRAAWEKCLTMLATYRDFYGEYPFVNEKYGIYEFQFGGGMEHQTMTGQGTFSESVTAHELGHQWWGDNVTCRTWSDIWLNEGFATYTEALWAERKPGSAGISDLHAAMASRRPPTNAGSVYRYDVSSAGTIFDSNYAYRKGAWVLHMLRHAVGDATFFDVLADYRAMFQGSAATTDDFAAVASVTSGRDLSAFFSGWVYGEGAPNFATSWSNLSLGGSRYLKLRVRQTQSAGLPTFWIPVDIRVNQTAGTATYPVLSDARDEYYVIPLTGTGAASSIVVDEFNWVLNGAKTTETFVAGPPVLLQASPGPGQTIESALAPSSVQLVFSENISASAASFQVVRDGSPQAFSYTYSAPDQRATLTFAAPLPPGTYTVNVSTGVTANGRALDGEIVGDALPSGDGQPGGQATYTFTVEAGCPADYNGDGFVDFFDLDAFITDFEAGAPGADFNGDGFIDFFDLDEFVMAFESAC